MPEADAAGRGGGVGEPDSGRIAARMQVEQRRAGRAQRRAGGETLDAAGDEEPGGRVGEEEEDGRRHQPASAASRTGRRPTRSETPPASSRLASTPKA